MLYVVYIIVMSGMVIFYFILGKMVYMIVLGDSLFYIMVFFIGGKEIGILYKIMDIIVFEGEERGLCLKFRL